MNEIAIAIPSYKRSEILLTKKNTLDYIPEILKDNTYLVVREEELEAYLPVAEKYGVGLRTIMLNDGEGIPETRDAIMHMFHEDWCEYLITMDDDLKFANHILEAPKTTYTPMTHKDFEDMVFDLTTMCFPEQPLVGISPRQFSNNRNVPFSFNSQIIQLQCMHIHTLMKAEIRYTYGAPYISDHQFNLSVLIRGYGNAVLNRYTRDDVANSKGGCEVDRTVDLQNKSAVTLYKKFPNFVKLLQKKNGAWKEPRINPRIQWKKAYEWGQKNNHGWGPGTLGARCAELSAMGLVFDFKENAFVSDKEGEVVYVPHLDIQCKDTDDWSKIIEEIKEYMGQK